MTTKLSSSKEKILVIAEELIESKGYANVSARTIAKNTGEGGISVGTLYHHFPNGKIDILLAIAEKYSDILDIPEFLADPKANLRAWLHKRLELDQKKRSFITAMEIEAMAHSSEIKELFNKSIRLRKQNKEYTGVAYKMMEKFAGKKISNEKAYKMILVMKTMIRRHIIFGNTFGSNDEFIDLLLKIVRALTDD
jgi:TetR/AcrR family transcriptional repressor of lmrAB and yxaGH operons